MIITPEPDRIEGRRLQDDYDFVIVTVEPRAGMVGRSAADDVRGRECERLGDRVHGRGFKPDELDLGRSPT